jgi:hypothetical protein
VVCRVDDGFCLVCLTTFSGELKEIPASTDPHVVACMFKQYFRELPSPIFPSGLYQAFLVCDQQIPNRFFFLPLSIFGKISPSCQLHEDGSTPKTHKTPSQIQPMGFIQKLSSNPFCHLLDSAYRHRDLFPRFS